MTSPASLRMLVKMFREGHPDATPETLACRLEDAAQTIEALLEQIIIVDRVRLFNADQGRSQHRIGGS